MASLLHFFPEQFMQVIQHRLENQVANAYRQANTDAAARKIAYCKGGNTANYTVGYGFVQRPYKVNVIFTKTPQIQ